MVGTQATSASLYFWVVSPPVLLSLVSSGNLLWMFVCWHFGDVAARVVARLQPGGVVQPGKPAR